MREAFTQFHYESLSPRIRTSLLLSLLYVIFAGIFWTRGSRAGRKEAEHPAVVLAFTLITLIPNICVLVMHARRKITAENYQLVMTIMIVAALVGGEGGTGRIRCGCAVERITRRADGKVDVWTDAGGPGGAAETFDHVILACSGKAADLIVERTLVEAEGVIKGERVIVGRRGRRRRHERRRWGNRRRRHGRRRGPGGV